MDVIEKKQKSFWLVPVLVLFNLLLAFVAFIKDIVLASYFGTSGIADAINLAFFLPDTLGNNLIGAAIGVSSIPILTKLSLNGYSLLYQETIQKIGAIIITGTLLIFITSLFLFQPILQYFPLENQEYSSTVFNYFLIMSPIICCAPLWIMGSSILQASRNFIVPAITPILFNFVLLSVLLWCKWQGTPQIIGGKVFSYASIIGTLLCAILTWIYILSKQKWSWSIKTFHLKSDYTEVKKVLLTFSAYGLVLLFSQVGLLAERFFASSLESGTIAALTYAYRLSQFPLWVFIAAITTFILPTISFQLEKNDFESLKRVLIKSLLLVIGSSGLISLVFVFFSEQIVSILFLRGSFTISSVQLTSEILKGYGLSIIGQSLYVFCTRYYVAQGSMKVPLYIGLIGSCLNIALLFTFVPWLGAGGIGYAIAVSSSLSGGFLLIHFIQNLRYVEKKGGESFE
ncbi:murein biosynthesis integral membrane protein MurJ [Psychrobacillus insolitus]|uniref:Murein biosynthesis integral membrane protein MurJ n=1 Tax=Psychrobacillus insolitus TaxID=1461 RepID=A0A2W7PFL6_9BACI|nr:lipid II flippase MurJ [Psychrobacillus insolitus]PZX07066.1 murein biosynthesis integral membrane protein MurJ [Psychrobacillus insolitus]